MSSNHSYFQTIRNSLNHSWDGVDSEYDQRKGKRFQDVIQSAWNRRRTSMHKNKYG